MKPLITESQIAEKVAATAATLNERGRQVAFVVILKGAICLIADLIRHLEIPFELYFISASSYGMKGTKPGEVTLSVEGELPLEGKEVIVVDDICDTGATLLHVIDKLEVLNPKSISTLVLLNKLTIKPREFQPDISLFDIEDLFVIGYGLDFKEQYRGLRGIFALEN